MSMSADDIAFLRKCSCAFFLTMDRCNHYILHKYQNSCALFSNVLPSDSPDHEMTNSRVTEPDAAKSQHQV